MIYWCTLLLVGIVGSFIGAFIVNNGWASNCEEKTIIVHNGALYKVINIDSDTSWKMAEIYRGAKACEILLARRR